MISRIAGVVEAVDDDSVHLRIGPVCVRVLVPACDRARWMGLIEEPAVLHTWMTFDGQVGGANLEPRLVGFASPEDRDLFHALTTVKGIGHRRALRAMELPGDQIARAIAAADTATLRTLPEVGKKLAETIVLELREKMEKLVGPQAPAARAGSPSAKRRDADSEPALDDTASAAVAVLMQMGEKRTVAVDLVLRAIETDAASVGAPGSTSSGCATPSGGATRTADTLVTSALRIRSSRT
ncbi:MAG: helix-hairpin-helix domain-containing protein [Planctomycetota bacterium]|nr:helix-hairpin-helix domain-containing protein [Planctomycetota bacterium]MDA1105857.1 helix-hairpin-helix domain-containing protein [Planctomycetota bacterium]